MDTARSRSTSLSDHEGQLLKRAWDAHCHPTDTPETLHAVKDVTTGGLVVMGTRPADWQAVKDLSLLWPDRVVAAFGVHPWYSPLASTDFSSKGGVWTNLAGRLQEDPRALVGEIGLDGVAKDRETGEKYPFPQQLAIFRHQVQLAARLRRPVSVHTVRSHGHLLDLMRELARDCGKEDRGPDGLPPAILHHSFSGSVEILRALCGLPNGVGRRMFFSFSAGVNGRSGKTEERIRAAPDDRICIESDFHDAERIDEAMGQACRMVASAKGWSMEETVERTATNTRLYLEPVLGGQYV
ncbi:hypothetical protein HKX48_002663 [Thoreauomyces humboldtii]|nr:hypothetical protein HKX48_002663 [Thoreauomyces humboldtii]